MKTLLANIDSPSKIKTIVESELGKRIDEALATPKIDIDESTKEISIEIDESGIDSDVLLDEISENTLDIIELTQNGKVHDLQEKIKDTLEKILINESTETVIDIDEDGVEEIVEAKIITKVNAKGVKRKRLSCGAGRKLQNGVCVIVQGSEKITKKKGAIKSARTKRAQGAGYALKVARKTKIAMRKRKGLGL